MRRGTRVGQAYVAVTADGSGINEEIVEGFDGAEGPVGESGERSGKNWRERFSREAFSEKFSGTLEKAGERLRETLGTSGHEGGKDFSRSFSDSMDNGLMEKAADRIGANVGGHMLAALISAIDGDLGENPIKDLFDKWMKETDDSVSRNSSKGGKGGFDIGKLFGAGSRNNFLNLLGKSIGSVANLTDKLSDSFLKLFTSGGDTATMFTKIAASGLALGTSLAVVAVAMAVLVSVASALLAVLSALLATIVSGLVGALLVGAGALGAFAAAAGLATAAFMSMTDAQKDLLSTAFRPLHEEMIGIGQLMITQMIPYFDTWSKNLQQALLLAAPVAQLMGRAFGEAGNALSAALSGPGFTNFAYMLGKYLPTITANMTAALGGFLNGLTGTFAALMPFVTRFSRYLAEVADRFDRWVNSAEGQNSISDFVARALVSLESLWNFVRELGGLISDVLFSPEAQAMGNSMFDGLASALATVRQAIADGSLEKWFNDAIMFGTALWNLMGSLGTTIANLYNSGVLQAVAGSFDLFAQVLDALNPILDVVLQILGRALPLVLIPIAGFLVPPILAIIALGETLEALGGILNHIPGMEGVFGDGAEWGELKDNVLAIGGTIKDLATGNYDIDLGLNYESPFNDYDPAEYTPVSFDMGALQASGAAALAQTNIPEPEEGEWKNPYIAYAQSLIASVPTVKETMKAALKELNAAVKEAIMEASLADTAEEVQSILGSQADALMSAGQQMVESAQNALESSANKLLNATSQKDANKILKQILKDQKDLTAALKNQAKLEQAVKMLNAQQVVSSANVEGLLAGFTMVNATLADYAAAREQLAVMIEDANQKLADAIAMRDQFATSVTDSAKQFASLLTASAKVVDGIAQALTADDITSNLRDRLQRMRDFQNNLRILLAQGLSNAAYQQLVEAGVESGGAYAEALVNGGQGAVQEVNGLVEEIGTVAEELGTEAAHNLYDAGVAAAQGLVDGLNSMSDKLEHAATLLGLAIAKAIKEALGLGDVLPDAGDPGTGTGGSGAAHGSGNIDPNGMHNFVNRGDGRCEVCGKVRNISRHINRNAGASHPATMNTPVAASREVAAYAATQAGKGSMAGVSGNSDDPRIRDLHIHTPTTDPEAVGHEVLNEVVGRLP